MKYKRFSCVILLISIILRQLEAVDFCKSYLDSLQDLNGTGKVSSYVINPPMDPLQRSASDATTSGHDSDQNKKDSWPRVHWHVAEQFSCHRHLSKVPNYSQPGCVIRNSNFTKHVSTTPLIHVLHIISSYLPQHTIRLRIDYPQASQQQLILVISVNVEQLFYLDVSSIMNVHASSAPPNKHKIILVGARSFLAFEQWGATSFMDVIHDNTINAPSETASLPSIINEFARELNSRHLLSSDDSTTAPPITSLYRLLYCSASEIIMRPLVPSLEHLSQDLADQQPHLDCSAAVNTVFYEMYEPMHSYSRKPISLNCSVLPDIKPSQSLTSIPDGGHFPNKLNWITYLQLTNWHVIEEDSESRTYTNGKHLLKSTKDYVFTVDISAPPATDNFSWHTLVLVLDFQLPDSFSPSLHKSPINLRLSAGDKSQSSDDDDPATWRVHVNMDNVHVPVVIETTMSLEFWPSVKEKPKWLNQLNVHADHESLVDHLQRTYCIDKVSCSLDYYSIPRVITPPFPDHKLLVSLQVRLHNSPTLFSEIMKRRSETECMGPKSASVSVDFSHLPEGIFSPPSGVKLFIGNLKIVNHCAVPSFPNIDSNKWLILEDQVADTAVCGWRKGDSYIHNMLIVDSVKERYFHIIYCSVNAPNHFTAPTFNINVFGDSKHKYPLPHERSSLSGPNMSDQNLSIKSRSVADNIDVGAFLFSELSINQPNPYSLLDFLVVHCELVYSTLLKIGDHDALEQAEVARQSILTNGCPVHKFHYRRPPDEPPWGNKSFEFMYPPPPEAVKEFMNNEATLMNGSSSSSSFSSYMEERQNVTLNVSLQCLILPCMRSGIENVDPWSVKRPPFAYGQCINEEQLCGESKKPGIVRVTSRPLFSYPSMDKVAGLRPQGPNTNINKDSSRNLPSSQWEWCSGPNCNILLVLVILCIGLLGCLLGCLFIWSRNTSYFSSFYRNYLFHPTATSASPSPRRRLPIPRHHTSPNGNIPQPTGNSVVTMALLQKPYNPPVTGFSAVTQVDEMKGPQSASVCGRDTNIQGSLANRTLLSSFPTC